MLINYVAEPKLKESLKTAIDYMNRLLARNLYRLLETIYGFKHLKISLIFIQMKNFLFIIINIYLTIIYKLIAQDVNDFSLYKMDSVYKAIQERIDSDTSTDEWRITLMTLNKGKYVNGKEDTGYKYIKLAYDNWPHDAYYNDFEEDKATTNYINKIYPKIFPKAYKYMIHIRDSIVKTYNKSLQEKLIQIYLADQKDRIEYDKHLSKKHYTDIVLKKATEKLDRNDLNRIGQIDSIIKIHGYPGKSLVGLKYSHYALIIILHSQSNKLINYFNLLEVAVHNGELGKENYSYFVDRFLIGTERRQLFGTQYKIINGEIIIFPIGHPDHLDERRNNFGFPKFKDDLKSLNDEIRKNEMK